MRNKKITQENQESEKILKTILEALRADRATKRFQLKASNSLVKTIFDIKAFDDTIGAALTNGVLALFQLLIYLLD